MTQLLPPTKSPEVLRGRKQSRVVCVYITPLFKTIPINKSLRVKKQEDVIGSQETVVSSNQLLVAHKVYFEDRRMAADVFRVKGNYGPNEKTKYINRKMKH